MAITETERAELVQALTIAIGERPAGTLMSSILPDGRDHLATKADLVVLEAKMDVGSAQVDGRFAAVDARFDQVDARFAAVDARFDQIDARFDKFEGSIERLRGEVALMLAKQNRTILLGLLACMITTWAGMLAGFLTLASMING